MVNVSAFDVPPPGLGVTTVTAAVPAFCTSEMSMGLKLGARNQFRLRREFRSIRPWRATQSCFLSLSM